MNPDLVAAEATYRAINNAFPTETKLAHALAYLRTYASPRVSGLLAHTGHVQHSPTKRAVDTGLHFLELLHHGLDSPQGHQVIESMNRMHHHWKIRNEDNLWVLGTFAVLGPQVIDTYAWRTLTDAERQATVDWWREVGTRMGITDIPTTYPDFAATFRDYELTHLRCSDAGQQLLAASWPVAMTQLPAPLRPLGRHIIAALTDEPARAALALPAVPSLARAALRTALVTASLAAHQRNPHPTLTFTPGASVGPYTRGYKIEELGVGEDHLHPAVQRATRHT